PAPTQSRHAATHPTRRSSDLVGRHVDDPILGGANRADFGAYPRIGRLKARVGKTGPEFSNCIVESFGPRRRHVIGHPLDEFDIRDRKSTRLNSSHVKISYAVF